MITDRFCRVWLLVALLAPVAPGALAEEPTPRHLESGLLLGHHDNFFFRGEGAEAPESDLLSVYLRGERERRLESGKLELFVELDATSAPDIDSGDYFAGSAGAKYKFGRSRVTGELLLRPNQVYFEEGDGVFVDQAGVEIGYRRDLRPGLWLGVELELDDYSFDPEEAERDATGREVSASARFPLTPGLGIRATLIYEEKNASAPRYDFTGSGFAVAFESRPAERVDIFARYKRREREYEDAAPGDRNFQRDDTVQDVVFNVRWQAAERWGVRLDTFYRDGESTRADRNYDGLRVMVGAFYLF